MELFEPKESSSIRALRGSTSQYVLTIVAVVIAGLLRWLMDPWLGNGNYFFTFLVAVVFAAWIGGWRPALLATVIGTLAAWFFFIPPRYFFLGISNQNLLGIFIFVLICLVVNLFGESMRIARERVKAQADLLRITLGSIGDAVITTDAEGNVTFLNDVAAHLTGWTNEQARGKPLEKVFYIVNEVTHQTVESPTKRALRDGTIVGLANHTILIARDAVERPINDSAAPIRNEAGEIVGSVLVFRDITEQRRLERATAEQTQATRFLASIVQSSGDAIISKSLDGIIHSWNAAAQKLFGYSAEEAVGRHISILIPMERLAEEADIIDRLRAGEQIVHFDTVRVKQNGQKINVSLTISPIKDEDGRIIGASKIVRDITEREMMENELRRAAAELSEADRRKDEFLATLAHELRNPLAPIRNGLQMMRLTGASDETTVQIRTMMERQLEQMVRLVDDLMDVSRISRGKLELRPSHVSLDSVIHSAVETSRPMIEQMGHQLTVNLPAPPVIIDADLTRMAQVFLNLLNNAAKYSNANGQIELTAERHGQEVTISVKDQGIGIAADQLSRIFEMFSQVDQSLEKAHGGLGIGLTLVRRIVDMHGGSVDARSEGPGRGSEFLVRLPIVSTPSPAPATQPQETANSMLRILVVDDNHDSANSLSKMLQYMGNETETAYDGEQALSAVLRFRPEVILLDIGLPKLSGYDVCRRIREQPYGKEMVIIAQTGWSQDGDRQRTREAGFDHHMVKPVASTDLMTILAGLSKSNKQ